MQREFPTAPIVAVGAVIVDAGRVLLVRRGTAPLKGHWTLPGGVLELGESLHDGVVREMREETGLTVEPVELVELLDRIYREEGRVRFHYVIADYLCRVTGGEAKAASDADEVRWVAREEWNSHSTLLSPPSNSVEASHPCARKNAQGWGTGGQQLPAGSLELDPVTVMVIEKGWQRAQALL